MARIRAALSRNSSACSRGLMCSAVAGAVLSTGSLAQAESPRQPDVAAPAAATAAVAEAPHEIDAQALASELATLRAEQRALAARLAASEARTAAAEVEQQRTRPKAVTFSAAPGQGLTVSLADERFSLTLRSRAQIRDTVLAQHDKPTSNEINVKTLRFWLTGQVLTRHLQYGIQLALGGGDFEAGSSSPIFDAYVDYSRLRDLNIRVGQFFVPFDRARTIREFALQLVDRQQVITELSLDRDVGLSLYSNDLGGYRGIFGYHLGFFGGEGRNRFGGAGVGFLYTARFVVRPFGRFDDDQEGDLSRLRRPRLAIAIAGAYNGSTNRPRSTTGTALTLGTIDYGHAAADLVFKCAGFSLLAEVLYRQARQSSFTGTIAGVTTREWSRSAVGYLVQAGVMVHDKVELAGRFDQLIALGQTDPTLVTLASTLGKELGAGVNVYLNGHAFKLQADYQYQFGDRVAGGKHAARFQLDATF